MNWITLSCFLDYSIKTTWKKFHITLKIGILLLIFGSLPFLIVMVLDSLGSVTSGNFALGTGPLLVLTRYPAFILIVVGIILTWRKANRATRQ